MFNIIHKRIGVPTIVLLFAMRAFPQSMSAQEATNPTGGDSIARTIHLAPLNLHAPFQIIAIINGDKEYEHSLSSLEVTLNEGNPDWVQKMAFKVINKSTKPIVAIEANVSVPAWETNQMAPKRYVRFHEGQFPEHALHNPDGSKTAEESSLRLSINPGDTGIVPLSAAGDKLSTRFPDSPTPLSKAQGLWIQFERVFFADGTMWQFNAYYIPSASLAGQYARVDYATWASYTAAAQHP